MKLNELLHNFEIFTTNEEKGLLEILERPTPMGTFNEREQVILQNLIRKSLISKIKSHGATLVIKNEY